MEDPVTPQPEREPSVLTPEMRDLIEWSWCVGIAETMAELTTRERAKWVMEGIPRAIQQTEAVLIRDFVSLRMDIQGILKVHDYWRPSSTEYPFTTGELLTAMATHPMWAHILEDERLEKEGDDDA